MSTRSIRANASGSHRSKRFTYTVAALAACALGTFVLWLWQRWDVYWLWLLSTNVIAFVFYRYDKWLSKHNGDTRVPEFTLKTLSIVGGFAGAALGMYMPERHKTSAEHASFRVALVAGALIQLVVIYFLYLRQ